MTKLSNEVLEAHWLQDVVLSLESLHCSSVELPVPILVDQEELEAILRRYLLLELRISVVGL